MTTLLKTVAVFSLVGLVTIAVGSTASGQNQPAAPGQGRGAAPAPAPPPPQQGHPSGKLVIWGDLVDFTRPGVPLRCFATSRFKRGQRAGFRMTAIDGGTGEVENTAEMVVHLKYGGGTVDIPMRWRGVGGFPASEYPRQPAEQWTGVWVVPDDAPIGMLSYTVTAKDRFGRTATFNPFPNLLAQFAVVE